MKIQGICTHVHMYTRTHVHTYTRTHTHTRTHAHTHTHTHTHTLSLSYRSYSRESAIEGSWRSNPYTSLVVIATMGSGVACFECTELRKVDGAELSVSSSVELPSDDESISASGELGAPPTAARTDLTVFRELGRGEGGRKQWMEG